MENTQIANIEKVLNLASIDDKQIVDNIKFNIKEGLVNPLQCMIALKRLEKIAENTKDDKEIKEKKILPSRAAQERQRVQSLRRRAACRR